MPWPPHLKLLAGHWEWPTGSHRSSGPGTLPDRPPFKSCRREELALQAKQLLEQDGKWHEQGELPSNMVTATSPKHFKQLITSAAAEGKLAVVDYMAPHCNGCRMLFPKLKQIAGNNVDCIFIKVGGWGLHRRGCSTGCSLLPWRACPLCKAAGPRAPLAAGQQACGGLPLRWVRPALGGCLPSQPLRLTCAPPTLLPAAGEH